MQLSIHWIQKPKSACCHDHYITVDKSVSKQVCTHLRLCFSTLKCLFALADFMWSQRWTLFQTFVEPLCAWLALLCCLFWRCLGALEERPQSKLMGLQVGTWLCCYFQVHRSSEWSGVRPDHVPEELGRGVTILGFSPKMSLSSKFSHSGTCALGITDLQGDLGDSLPWPAVIFIAKGVKWALLALL